MTGWNFKFQKPWRITKLGVAGQSPGDAGCGLLRSESPAAEPAGGGRASDGPDRYGNPVVRHPPWWSVLVTNAFSPLHQEK
jgi:hypothetical protein